MLHTIDAVGLISAEFNLLLVGIDPLDYDINPFMPFSI